MCIVCDETMLALSWVRCLTISSNKPHLLKVIIYVVVNLTILVRYFFLLIRFYYLRITVTKLFRYFLWFPATLHSFTEICPSFRRLNDICVALFFSTSFHWVSECCLILRCFFEETMILLLLDTD